jgi:hypothetical protein
VRDVFQVVSALVSVLIIWQVFRRTKRTGEPLRDWLPIITLSVLLLLFYIGVFIDVRFDIFNSSEASSTVRLISGVLILIFVRYFPNRIRA